MRHLFKHSLYRFSKYQKDFQQAINNPQGFWKNAAQQIKWETFPKTILDTSRKHFFRWFPDGKLNITQSCLDRHLPQLQNQVAYYIQSPVTNSSTQITYKNLHSRVSKLAHSLQTQFKIKPGDRVIIYMPMTIQGIVAQLACARIGAIHCVVFGGFSSHELASRIVNCNASLIICGNAGIQNKKIINYLQMVDHAIQISQRKDLRKIIFYRNVVAKRQRKYLQYDFIEVQNSGTGISPIILPSNHPLYILYTSGTTGSPKGIARDHGGTAVALQHTLNNIYGLKKGDGLFCSSDIGWVLGKSYITYAPLIGGLRSIFFQGKPVGTPDAGIFWRIIQKRKINHLYTSPTAMRTIRKNDPQGKFIKDCNLSQLRGISVVGEKCDTSIWGWMQDHFPNKFLNQCYWQTETGFPILTNYCGNTYQLNKSKPGSSTKPYPGFNSFILDPDTHEECSANKTGIICIKQPLPPSFMLTLWDKDDSYLQKYFTPFEGYYNTGDSGFKDEDGYYYIMSRIDDIINTAGHRLSTGQMEQVLLKHNKIAQAVVIGFKDEIKGQVPIGFVTLKQGYQAQAKQLQKELVSLVRQQIGPVASFKICHLVKRLPKTRSGKYLRHVIRKISNELEYAIPPTVQDITAVYQIQEYIKNWLKHI